MVEGEAEVKKVCPFLDKLQLKLIIVFEQCPQFEILEKLGIRLVEFRNIKVSHPNQL